MRMISAWSKSKSVLVVPKTRKKQEHHCDAKQQLPSVNKSGDANIESIESQPLSSSITSTATIVAPDCIDAFARKSKRCLHLPTILTCVLGSFGKKRVKLKQSDWSSPSCKKCKKPTRASPRKDLPASPVVSETTHTGATATSVSSIVFNTDTQSETVSKYVVVDDVTPTKLDNNEANDVECTNKQNSIEIQSETFSVQSLSTNVGPDISEESILLADSSMSDLRDAMLFEENPKLPDSEHAMIQNDSNSQIVQVQIQQSSSSAQTENYVSILRSPKIVDDSSGSRKSQLNGPKLFVPGESKLDVRKTKKFAGSVDINELGIDKLFPACYQLENVITENKHDKVVFQLTPRNSPSILLLFPK